MIYFIESGTLGNVKIGFTIHPPSARLASLQTASDRPLRLLASAPGDRQVEARWHERWSHLRVPGAGREWFRRTPELMAFMAEVADLPALLQPYARHEPGLEALYRLALGRHADADPDFCANAVWYGYPPLPSMKKALASLVGWHAYAAPPLNTNTAYSACYEAVYEALPDCRGRCACGAIMRAFFEVGVL